ncbi:hypothetical protein O181_051170 [Austropuccinia psidii MF-1]|uniref:Uncharacterized protein n=1 Tax=Austropuccinia psidii MF-1 TaxID=1389203 RepID=A0A9Q3DWM2_9BASI|nr:hypothetical protein [Austropuccinia psidii MF-1]
MEDARTSTSSQRLASTFETLIESTEAEITSISVVRPESLSTGNNRDIPIAVQELLISSSEEAHGARKNRGASERLDTHVLQRTNPTDEILVENQSMFSEDQKTKLAEAKENSQVEAPQASTSKNMPQKVPNQPKKTPKTNRKGKKKEKRKAKTKWNKPYPQNYRIFNKEKPAMENVFNMTRTLMEFKNKKEERLNQSFPKK